MKRCQTSLVREMQVKTTMRYYLMPIRMPTLKNLTSIGDEVEKSEHLSIAGENVKWRGYCGKQYGGF